MTEIVKHLAARIVEGEEEVAIEQLCERLGFMGIATFDTYDDMITNGVDKPNMSGDVVDITMTFTFKKRDAKEHTNV